MKRKKLFYLILPLSTLLLEILPFGAVLNFMRPSTTEGTPASQFKELYSYFNLTPFGYANFAPLLTAIVTCFIILLLLIFCFTDNSVVLKVIKTTLFIGTVLSLCPLLLGIDFFSLTGALITLTLLAEFILILFTVKH